MGPYPLTESNVEGMDTDMNMDMNMEDIHIHEHGALDTIPEDVSQGASGAADASSLDDVHIKAGWLLRSDTLADESVADSTRGVIEEQQEKGRPSGSTGAVLIDPARNDMEGPAHRYREEPSRSSYACSPTMNWKMWMLLGILAIAVTLGIYFIVSKTVQRDARAAAIPASPSPSVILTDDFLPTDMPSASPSTRPSLRPSQSMRPTLHPFMLPDALDTVSFLVDTVGPSVLLKSSLQNDAMLWIINDDPAAVRIITHGEFRVQQRYLLTLFHFQLEGDHWLTNNFLTSNHECDWMGIECNEEEEIVRGLWLESTNLTGSLPSELGLLTNIEWISLRNNSLTGTIPQSWYTFPKLSWWDMRRNFLSGQLSSQLWHMPSMRALLIHDNALTGQVPEVTNFSIPLLEFDASDNQLNGTIPASLWELSRLTFLYLSDNQLEGTIPPFVSDHALQLKALWLQGNLLEGTLPESLGLLTSLAKLFLCGNAFTSTVPASWFAMRRLQYLDLSDNSLSGTIPELIDLPVLTDLLLNNNTLKGALPESLGLLNNLGKIVLCGNAFTSTVPASWFAMPSLQYLDLSENSLSGTIPELVDSPVLTDLFLNNNTLSGILPESLPLSIVHLWFQYNTFTGVIPEDFAVGYENLAELLLHGNDLSGEISNSLCDEAIRLVKVDCLNNESSTSSVRCNCCQCY